MSAYLIEHDDGRTYLKLDPPTDEELRAAVVWRIDAPVSRVFPNKEAEDA